MRLTEDKIQKLHELEFEDERMKKILDAAIETWKKVGYVFGKFGKDFDLSVDEYKSENPCCLMMAAGFGLHDGCLPAFGPDLLCQLKEDFSISLHDYWECIHGFDGSSNRGMAKDSLKIREILLFS